MSCAIEYLRVTSRRHDNALPGSKQHDSLLDRCKNDGLFHSGLYSTFSRTIHIHVILYRLPKEPNVKATLN